MAPFSVPIQGRALPRSFFVASAPATAFELTSPALSSGTWIRNTLAKECGGGNVSRPPRPGRTHPAGTKSFVVTLSDRDAPDGFGWWHWQVLKIPQPRLDGEGAGRREARSFPGRGPGQG